MLGCPALLSPSLPCPLGRLCSASASAIVQKICSKRGLTTTKRTPPFDRNNCPNEQQTAAALKASPCRNAIGAAVQPHRTSREEAWDWSPEEETKLTTRARITAIVDREEKECQCMRDMVRMRPRSIPVAKAQLHLARHLYAARKRRTRVAQADSSTDAQTQSCRRTEHGLEELDAELQWGVQMSSSPELDGSTQRDNANGCVASTYQLHQHPPQSSHDFPIATSSHRLPPAPGWKHTKGSRKPGRSSTEIVVVLHRNLMVESGGRDLSAFDVRYGAYPPRKRDQTALI
ncbi:hypothetical protein BBK36DRAFT_1145163 [Trichoderma citrinoviride]|uniref:Uncharacterized protein n=1 Tax=Trichoderma citrinoviride TaxID=58853 RepID=A0A2T4AYN1_9HYPO|nr:hypothetical protein BBK36DRAFT_1145163 [Trichoderma citrinoviride]PTB62088.1 hypothetical protein BBK36DRAFT_1145163 [Trichoderma citrinoviride]